MNSKDIFLLLKKEPNKITKEMIKSLNKDELLRFIELTKIYKKRYFNKQAAKKKQINSLYGALGNEFFPLYDIRLSKSITSYGRYYIKSIGNRINSFLLSKYDYKEKDALIYTHTDSTHFNLSPAIKDKTNFIEESLSIGNDLLKISDAEFKFVSKICNSKRTDVLKINFESISDKGIYSSAGNYYVRNVYVKNKLNEPKIKIVGMEFNKSSTSLYTKNLITKSLNLFLDKDKYFVLKYLEEVKKQFLTKDLNLIGIQSNISEIEKQTVINKERLTSISFLLKIKSNVLYNINNINNINDKIDIINIINKCFYNIEEHISNKFNINNKFVVKLLDTISNIINKYNINIDNKMIDEFLNSLIDTPLSYFDSLFKEESALTYDLYKKGTINYYRGAIVFNNYIKENNLNFDLISNGDKIKYIHLKKNNPFNENIISFKDDNFIKDLNLKEYIDYDLQFEKSFLGAFKQILEPLNIDYIDNNNSKSLFQFESLF